jgi:hypothetical protein
MQASTAMITSINQYGYHYLIELQMGVSPVAVVLQQDTTHIFSNLKFNMVVYFVVSNDAANNP